MAETAAPTSLEEAYKKYVETHTNILEALKDHQELHWLSEFLKMGKVTAKSSEVIVKSLTGTLEQIQASIKNDAGLEYLKMLALTHQGKIEMGLEHQTIVLEEPEWWGLLASVL